MHYLDYAATTPVAAEVAAAMVDVLTKNYGNPSSQHSRGRKAKELVDESRITIASALGCKDSQLLFTPEEQRATTGRSMPRSIRTAVWASISLPLPWSIARCSS